MAKLHNFHFESLFQLRKAGEIYWLHLSLVVPVMIAVVITTEDEHLSKKAHIRDVL